MVATGPEMPQERSRTSSPSSTPAIPASFSMAPQPRPIAGQYSRVRSAVTFVTELERSRARARIAPRIPGKTPVQAVFPCHAPAITTEEMHVRPPKTTPPKLTTRPAQALRPAAALPPRRRGHTRCAPASGSHPHERGRCGRTDGAFVSRRPLARARRLRQRRLAGDPLAFLAANADVVENPTRGCFCAASALAHGTEADRQPVRRC